MKTKLQIINYVLIFILVFLKYSNARAFEYRITFTGSGTSSTIDSVVVQNLYKSTQVTVPGGSQLRLTDEESAIGSLNTIADIACVYPNPIFDNATYSFVAINDGNTLISVFGLDGRKVAGLGIELQQGKQSFLLSLPKGVYLILAKGNGFSYSTKIISLSITDHQPKISYNGNVTYNKPQMVGAPEVKMQYTTGDQLLYKGYSGNYCTIVTDKPTETKTTDFKFVDCTDTDGNHYAVVHIGTQTWMAENLKTTKYRNGEAIGTTTPANKDISSETEPKYQWAYNGDENKADKYGRLYTWYTVADARSIAPAGWHISSDAEWTILVNYLIANGYNSDRTTIDNKIAKALSATTDWDYCSESGTIGNDLTKNNSSGFTALPCGYRYNKGSFLNVCSTSYWWGSIEDDSNNYELVRYFNYNYMNLRRYSNFKNDGFSVRCIKDNSNPLNIATSYIPAGTFTMGSPVTEASRNIDETQHQVTLSAFRMSQYEITNEQYAAFLNTKGVGSDGLYAAGTYPSQPLIYQSSGIYDWGLHYTNNLWEPVAGYENHPVIFVSWYGATEFATYTGGSLPTEAQWEYACRAGTTTPFNTGECLTNEQANYNWLYPYSGCNNNIIVFPDKTQAVGVYKPNGCGLYDMHGNVFEWCSDWYAAYPIEIQINPSGTPTGSVRIFRGGFWNNFAQYCRSSFRNSDYPQNGYFNIGFRLVFVP